MVHHAITDHDTGYDRPNLLSVDPPVARLDTEVYGRTELRDGILQGGYTAQDGSAAKVHILCGLGGSGKTHLALAVAQGAQRAGREVWWVSASQVSSGMREVATRLKAPDKEVDRAWAGITSANDLVWRFLNQYKRPWLLVFDNADSPDVLGPSGGHGGRRQRLAAPAER